MQEPASLPCIAPGVIVFDPQPETDNEARLVASEMQAATALTHTAARVVKREANPAAGELWAREEVRNSGRGPPLSSAAFCTVANATLQGLTPVSSCHYAARKTSSELDE